MTDQTMPPLLPGDADTPPKKKKKAWKIALFVLLNAGVIAYTACSEFGAKESTQKFRDLKLNMVYLLGAVGCVLVAILAETFKYAVMIRKISGKPALRTAFEVCILGKYYDNITPSGIGGQPFQIYFLHKKGFPDGPSAAMPIAGFLSSQFGFAILALTVFIVNPFVLESDAVRITAYVGLFCYVFLPIAIVFFTVAPKTADRVFTACIRWLGRIHIIRQPEKAAQSMLEKLSHYRSSILLLTRYKRILFLEVLLPAILFHAAMCSMPWFVLSAFGGQISWFDTFSVCLFLYAAIAVIPTPGNSGAAEGSFYAIFSALTAGYLFWAMLVWRFLCYYIFIVLGVFVYGLQAWEKSSFRARLARKKDRLSPPVPALRRRS